MKFDLSFLKNASTRRKRIYLIIAIMVLSIILTIVGSYIPLSAKDAATISNELNNTVNQNKANNTLTQYIFLNNFQICLLMFIPVAGAALGLFILFNTGIALGAIATTSGYPVWFGLANLVLTPVFWLEFAAYSIAMAESIWLFRRLIQGRWLQVRETLMYIGVCSLVLLVGAYVEVWLINLAG
jgi:uncharacterized membrane protein SpoIIM required for sporulation